MESKQKILVIIPAYNEESAVGEVVEGVKNHLPQAHILVVNDGSVDRTSEKAKAKGAIVLDLPFNLGIGGAMQAGYKYADEKGYGIAIQVDGDGQTTIDEVQKAINQYLGISPAEPCCDVNGNGQVSIDEVQKVINAFLGL